MKTLDSPEFTADSCGTEEQATNACRWTSAIQTLKYGGGGKTDSYLDFLVNTLSQRSMLYRTKPWRICRNHGSSLGSWYPLCVAQISGRVFKAGIFSPSVWFYTNWYELMRNHSKIQSQKNMLLCGDNEEQRNGWICGRWWRGQPKTL